MEDMSLICWSVLTIEWARERARTDEGDEGMTGWLGRRAQESKAKGEGRGEAKEGGGSAVGECARNVTEEGRGCVVWTGSCSRVCGRGKYVV